MTYFHLTTKTRLAIRSCSGGTSYTGERKELEPSHKKLLVCSFESQLLSSVLSQFPGPVSAAKLLCNLSVLQLLSDLVAELGVWASPCPTTPGASLASKLMPRLPLLPAH